MSDPRLGTVVGGCRLESVLGRGGMGVVYLAEQMALKRKVALKLITQELAENVAFRERFERESQMAARIDHPNVVPVYEAGEDHGQLFLVMRYIAGTDLRALIVRGGLDPSLAARYVGQIAGALDAAHALGLVHRDVKPANILISNRGPEGECFLADFGLTKLADASGGLTNTGQWVGTLDYVAPEQIQGTRIDARTDVYALGCVLYQALTGQVPFAKDSDVAKMWAHMNEAPPTLSATLGSGSRALDQVVQRALAKSPDDRFPSAGDLGRAAIAAAEGLAVTQPEHSVATGAAAPGSVGAATNRSTRISPRRASEPQPAAEPPKRGRRRGLFPAIAAAGLLFVAGGAAAIVLTKSQPSKTQLARATDPTSKRTPARLHAKKSQPQVQRTEKHSSSPTTGTGDTVGIVTGCGVPYHSEPNTISLGCDGSHELTKLTWLGWGTGTATGKGRYSQVTCDPDCSTGAVVTHSVTLVAGTIASCPKDSRAYYTKLAITSTDASQAVHESQTLPVCPTIAASSSSAPSTTSQPSSDISQTFHRDYVDGCRKTQSRAGCECIFTQLTQNQGIDSEEKLKQLSERVVTATRTGDRSAFPSEFVASVKACKSLIRPTG